MARSLAALDVASSLAPPLITDVRDVEIMDSDNGLTLQGIIFKCLSKQGVDTRLGQGKHYFVEVVLNAFPQDKKPPKDKVIQMMWTLLGRGLIYIDISQPSTDNWRWQLTDSGRKAIQESDYNPDDPERFLQRIKIKAPLISTIAMKYL